MIKEEIKIYLKEYYQQHKSEHNKRTAEYYKINRKDILNKQKKYNKKRKILKKKYDKKYNQKNKYKIKERAKKYYLNNIIKILKRRKKYYKTNKNKCINQSIRYSKNRRIIDINFRLRGNLTKRVWDALKNNYKSIHTIHLIGCNIEKLKKHLKSKFTKGMSWKNYGKWHVDHIRPCASFDLSKPKEQRKCFHYTNLQPLWAKENILKSDKIINDEIIKEK